MRDGWAFHQTEITGALSRGGRAERSEEAQRWLESLGVQRDLSAEEFAREVREYLDRRGQQHRVLFMVDEVGQYVGDNSSLMLNLQSVAEELGTQAPGRAWILVTSQEDMDRVLDGHGQEQRLLQDSGPLQYPHQPVERQHRRGDPPAAAEQDRRRRAGACGRCTTARRPASRT